jgi:serine acetyltransferase
MKLQISYFIEDIRRILGKNKYRIIIIWFSRTFLGVLIYRIERGFFLTLGKTYTYLRIPFYPLLSLFQAFTNIDIHYKADIKGGINILHPSTGIVITGKAIIGNNLTLVGGNIIGVDAKKKGEFIIGNDCQLGANAVVIGPLILSDNINIGASACVVSKCNVAGATLVGVPAKII